jgi:hypothetical protein
MMRRPIVDFRILHSFHVLLEFYTCAIAHSVDAEEKSNKLR